MREVIIVLTATVFMFIGCATDDTEMEGDAGQESNPIETVNAVDPGNTVGQPPNSGADNGPAAPVSEDDSANKPTADNTDQQTGNNTQDDQASETDSNKPTDGQDEPTDGEPVDTAETSSDSESKEDTDQPADTDASPKPEPLPASGKRLSICNSDADCQSESDDLLCFGTSLNTIGFCTEDCVEDSHCQEIGGVPATCLSGGMCGVSCENNEDANCPVNMGCASFLAPESLLLGIPIFDQYCTYKEDTIQPSKAALEKCDYDFECPDDLACYHPGNLGGNPVGNGFCISPCRSDEDCQAYQQDGVEVTCGNLGHCDFKCVMDADCPNDMICRSIEGLGWNDEVCWYL